MEAVLGSTTTLSCRPPVGQPEPKVRWIKDGERLRTVSDRVSVSDAGSLQIRDLRREDAGSYLCVASNIAGERESAPAQIAVRGFCYCPRYLLTYLPKRHIAIASGLRDVYSKFATLPPLVVDKTAFCLMTGGVGLYTDS